MLRKFNSFIEKWMALVTPTCLLLGVCFPDIAKCGLPYVPAVFAFMTFAGALKSRFKDVANVFRHPGSLLIIMLLVHVVIPTASCGAGHLFFGNNMELITGMVLEFAVPTAVVSLMWVTIYDGNSPLSLSLVVLDTVLAPFLIPATLKILLGSAVTIDPARMMRELIFMVALPAVVAMVINHIICCHQLFKIFLHVSFHCPALLFCTVYSSVWLKYICLERKRKYHKLFQFH